MKGTALYALLGECAEIPMDLRRKKILIKYLLKLHNNTNNPAYDILTDQRLYHLQINNKSVYLPLLNSYLQDNNISLKSGNRLFSDYPWPSLDDNVDLSTLKDLTLAKTDLTICSASIIPPFIASLRTSHGNVIYVDGSVREEGKVGAAVLCPEIDIKCFFRLPDGLSIYFAEAFAILNGIRCALNKKCDKFAIISDNMRVLEDIKSSNYSHSPHPFIIHQIRLELLKHAPKPYLIKWLPGNKYQTDFKLIDTMAKEAVSKRTTDSIDFTNIEAIQMIDEWIWKLWTERWTQKVSCAYQSLFLPTKKPLFWDLPRHQEITINRLRLLQSKLKAGLHKIGLHETGFCDFCGTTDNSYHFIMECTAINPIRNKLKSHFAQNHRVWSFQAILNDLFAMTHISKYASVSKISI